MPRRCSLCATGMDVTPLDGESERARATRLGVKRSTLKRHLPHARTALAVVVSEPEAECCKTCGHSPDADEDVNARMIRDARRFIAKAEFGGDIRGAVVAHKELRDTLRYIQELLGPASEDTPAVLVSFTFPPSGLGREAFTTNDPNEYLSRNVEAATPSEAAGATSATTANVVVSQPNVEPDAHRVEEIVATPAKAPDSVAAPAAPAPPMLPPLDITFSSFRPATIRRRDRDD